MYLNKMQICFFKVFLICLKAVKGWVMAAEEQTFPTHCFTPGCPGPLEAAQSWGQQPCTASSLMATGAHTGASIDCLPGHPKQCLTHRAANPAPGFSVFCWDTCTMLCRALSTPSEPPSHHDTQQLQLQTSREKAQQPAGCGSRSWPSPPEAALSGSRGQ